MSTPLEEVPSPLTHPIPAEDLGTPSSDHDSAYRTRMRGLHWMQKEAIVSRSRSNVAWRIASDEGEYLNADDVAPPPLGVATAGIVSSYASEIRHLARTNDISMEGMKLILEAFYTASGSRLRGTRSAKVLTPELDVHIENVGNEDTVREMVSTAVKTAPIAGLLGEEHTNTYSLVHDGERIDPGEVPEFAGEPPDDPSPTFDRVSREVNPQDPPLTEHTGETSRALPDGEERYADKLGTDEAGHILHLKGTCTVADDGRLRIVQQTYRPQATTFRFVADGPEEWVGMGRAPDGITYFSAAIAFCLTTHLAIYANLNDVEIDFRIVQDTRVSSGAGPDDPAGGEPVESHVFLDSSGDDGFAREALAFSNRSCYVHELCRSRVEPEVDVIVSR